MFQITTYASIAQLPPDVAHHASYAQRREIFQSIEWFQCLQETVFAGEREAVIHVARDEHGAPVGLLACSQPSGRTELRALTNYYTLDFHPGLFDERQSDSTYASFIEALIAHAANEQPKWPYVHFDYLRSDRSDAAQLTAALRRHGFLTHRSRQYENWYLDVGGVTFEHFFAARSSQLRNTITRKEKKIKKAHNLEFKIFTHNDAALAEAIESYVAIYNSSWKRPEPYPKFIPAFVRLCADLSILRLGVAYLDGKAAAAQLWVNSGERTIIYKLAYDEAFADLSVGAVLSRELFRNAIDVDRVREIDYGIGSEAYKREWMSGVRYFDRLEGYRLNSLRGLSRLGMAGLSAIGGKVRHHLKSRSRN